MPPRAYASTVDIANEGAGALTGGGAGRQPLTGGWSATVWGTELYRAMRAAVELAPGVCARVPA